ncbi:uncharacterized protein [Ptychodera flava]|uniref:uncharacterized protein n=1 Tax=Ptychodera flava TaxID=63121 RepID=UPI00396A5011
MDRMYRLLQLVCPDPNGDTKKRLELLQMKSRDLLQAIDKTKIEYQPETAVEDETEFPDQLPDPPTKLTIENRQEAEQALRKYCRDLLTFRRWLKALTQQFQTVRRQNARLMKSLKTKTKRVRVQARLVITEDVESRSQRREDSTSIPSHIDDSQVMVFLEKYYLYEVSSNQIIDYVIQNIDFED